MLKPVFVLLTPLGALWSAMGYLFSALFTLVIGLIGWGTRLEIKTNVTASKHEDLKEFFEKLMIAKIDPINQRLDRIERALNGSLPHA